MKIRINGKLVYEGSNPASLKIDVDVDPAGEECGPVQLAFRNGHLKVRPDDTASITVNSEDGGCLEIGEGQLVTVSAAPRPVSFDGSFTIAAPSL